MKEIGGFFEFEFDKKIEYYHDATAKVNSGRNAINYILQASQTKKVYVPYFTCGTVIEPIKTLGLEYVFYEIDENLEIKDIRPGMLKENEKIIYINYFGIKNKYVNELAVEYTDKLLIDNTQAFFKKPIKNTNICYSPRKFFGVPDGGYVYTKTRLETPLEKEISYDRCQALLARVENDASDVYTLYTQHNKDMCSRPLKSMSELTQNILSSIDYKEIRLTRERNFYYLHNQLHQYNNLNIDEEQVIGPMVYPLWIKKEGLRDFLIQHKVYVATYWKEVLDYIDDLEKVESKLVMYLLPIPIDQRYEISDMKRIATLVKTFLAEWY